MRFRPSHVPCRHHARPRLYRDPQDCDKIGTVPPAPGRGKPSAAQNETVVITCRQCGAVNGADAANCCFCDTRLSQNTGEKSAPPPRPKAPQTEGNLAIATDWRSEVASRLEAYRARRKRLGSDSSPAQPSLLFDEDP